MAARVFLPGSQTQPVERQPPSRRWRFLGRFKRAGLGAACEARIHLKLAASCLNAASNVSAVSYAARPKTEHLKGVGAQRRPPQHEPAPAGRLARAHRRAKAWIPAFAGMTTVGRGGDECVAGDDGGGARERRRWGAGTTVVGRNSRYSRPFSGSSSGGSRGTIEGMQAPRLPRAYAGP